MEKLKIKIVLIGAILSALIVFSSCQDWLNIEPQDKLIKEKFWEKTADVNSALAATYDAMRGLSEKSMILGEVRADLVEFDEQSYANYAKIAGSDINPSMGETSWSDYYKVINLANSVMHFDKQVFEKDETFTKEMLQATDAEALFLRSLAYYYLIRIWKDVPLVTNATLSDTSNIFVPKNTEKEVVRQVISDLEKAKDMAYTTEFEGTDYFYGRANRYSIIALLADIYLWDEQYQKCIDACNEIINANLYSLENQNSFFNIYYPGNSAVESIMEFQYNDEFESQENPIYKTMLPLDTEQSKKMSFNTKELNQLMESNDLRRFGGELATWKYMGKDLYGTVPREENERSANWIVYRYADVLLFKAEAAIELEQYDVANDIIRMIAERSGVSFSPLNDKELLRQAILVEKSREFLFEGKRWFDILRVAKRDNFANKQLIMNMILSGADIKQQAVLRTKVYDTLSYYLPINKKEIDYNPNLKQNSYYNR